MVIWTTAHGGKTNSKTAEMLVRKGRSCLQLGQAEALEGRIPVRQVSNKLTNSGWVFTVGWNDLWVINPRGTYLGHDLYKLCSSVMTRDQKALLVEILPNLRWAVGT